MNGLKKFLASLFAAVMFLSVIALPASAESMGAMIYTPPAGYNDLAGHESNYHVYHYYANGGWLNEIIGVETFATSMKSLHDMSEQDWAAAMSKAGDFDITNYNISAFFVQINGQEYVEIDESFDFVDDGDSRKDVTLFYIDGIGNMYEYSYWSYDPSLPHFAAFNNMISSVNYQSPASAGGTIRIYVNGSEVFPDAAPVIKNDRTLVPIRAVAEALGYSVSWDAPNKCVTMSKPGFDIQVMIGSTSITSYYFSQPQYGYMDVVAEIIQNRTFIPLRAVAEAMGCEVSWDGTERSVYIYSGGEG